MQIRQQIVDLLLAEHVAESFHLVATQANDFAYALVIGGHAAHAEVRLLENALQAGALASARRVRRVAAVAVLVIDVPSRSLLRIQAQFGVAFAALYFASGAGSHHDEPATGENNHDEAQQVRDRSLMHQKMDLQ